MPSSPTRKAGSFIPKRTAYATHHVGLPLLPFNNPFLVACKDDPRFIANARKVSLVPASQAAP